MGAKRASLAAPSPAKRAKAEVSTKIEMVAKALSDVEALPGEVPATARQMLAKGAGAALGSTVEERHELQGKVLGHIREALSDISNRLAATKTASDAASTQEAENLEARRRELAAAREALAEAEASIAAQEERLAACKQELHGFEAELKLAASDVKANQKLKDTLEKEKARFTGLPEKPEWKALLAGEHESEKDRNKSIRAVVGSFQRLGAEEALLASAPAALGRRPEERKGFDTMVIDSLRGVLTTGAEASDARLAEIATEREKLDAEASEKTAVVEKARRAHEAELEALSKLQATRDDRAAAKTACEGKVDETSAALDRRAAECATADTRIEEFGEVVRALDFLASRSSAPLAAEQEPPAAEAAQQGDDKPAE